MSVYEVAGHPALSGKAQVLGGPMLEAQVLLAETLLGVSAPAYTDAALLEKAILAIVLQVNFQMEEGIDPLIVKRMHSTHTSQTVEYWGRYIDPRALILWSSTLSVEKVSGRFTGVITSLRRAPEPTRFNRHGGYL